MDQARRAAKLITAAAKVIPHGLATCRSPAKDSEDVLIQRDASSSRHAIVLLGGGGEVHRVEILDGKGQGCNSIDI